jgi:hypothetical protein
MSHGHLSFLQFFQTFGVSLASLMNAWSFTISLLFPFFSFLCFCFQLVSMDYQQLAGTFDVRVLLVQNEATERQVSSPNNQP